MQLNTDNEGKFYNFYGKKVAFYYLTSAVMTNEKVLLSDNNYIVVSVVMCL